jgi:hypothetical protein
MKRKLSVKYNTEKKIHQLRVHKKEIIRKHITYKRAIDDCKKS